MVQKVKQYKIFNYVHVHFINSQKEFTREESLLTSLATCLQVRILSSIFPMMAYAMWSYWICVTSVLIIGSGSRIGSSCTSSFSSSREYIHNHKTCDVHPCWHSCKMLTNKLYYQNFEIPENHCTNLKNIYLILFSPRSFYFLSPGLLGLQDALQSY